MYFGLFPDRFEVDLLVQSLYEFAGKAQLLRPLRACFKNFHPALHLQNSYVVLFLELANFFYGGHALRQNLYQLLVNSVYLRAQLFLVMLKLGVYRIGLPEN